MGREATTRTRGRKWMRIRAQVLSRCGHLCEQCTKGGKTTPARHVDHITPLHKGGTDDLNNLMGLCIPCHEAKTADDMGYRHKAKIGLDGWPE